jgi:hypothetical protein
MNFDQLIIFLENVIKVECSVQHGMDAHAYGLHHVIP